MCTYIYMYIYIYISPYDCKINAISRTWSKGHGVLCNASLLYIVKGKKTGQASCSWPVVPCIYH